MLGDATASVEWTGGMLGALAAMSADSSIAADPTG